MKSKRLGISIVSLILGLICSLGFVSIPKQKVETSAAAAQTYTQYMLEGGSAVKKEGLATSAGKLFINEQEITSQDELSFVLTEPNINFKAESNIGFELKGWYIAYTDAAKVGDIVPGTNNGYISIIESEQKICGDNIIIHGYTTENKMSTMQIEQMQDSLLIAPVFDYEYYYITLRGVGTQENIGPYKHGDEVSFTRTLDDGINVDATAIVSDKIELAKDDNATLENGEYQFIKDATEATKSFAVKFLMTEYQNVVIELKYDFLYRVDLQLCLETDDALVDDVTTEEGDAFDEILSCISFPQDRIGNTNNYRNRYFSKLGKTSYFVKNGSRFEISAADVYKEKHDSVDYVYYEFNSLGGSADKTLNLNNINANTTVKVKYTHKKYNVEFIGVEYNSDKTVVVNNDLVDDANKMKELTRVSGNNSVELSSALKTNVGFTHWGFVQYDRSKTQYEETDKIADYVLDSVKPKNVVIYVVYTRNAYSFRLTDLNNVELTDVDNSKTYYPIKSINGSVLDYEAITDGTHSVVDNSGNVLKAKLGDTITFELQLNNGFSVESVAGEAGSDNIYSFVLDQAFLTGKGAVIDLAVVASTINYTLTYKISKYEKAYNADTMAEIEVEGKSITEQDADGYISIVVPNLKYYEKLTLKSTANKTLAQDKSFVFRYFTSDFSTTISGVDDSGKPDIYKLPVKIAGNLTVYVVYSEPSTQMQILVDGAPAEHGITFKVTQNGSEKTADTITGLYTLTDTVDTNIETLNLDLTNKMFGYKFVDFKLYKNEIGGTVVTTGTSVDSFIFKPDGADLNIVVLTFAPIEYKINLMSNIPAFKNEEKDLSLSGFTVKDPYIEFEKRTGYYVSQIEFRDKDSYATGATATFTNYSNMAQSNSTGDGGTAVDGRQLLTNYYFKFQTVEAFKAFITEHANDSGVIEARISFAQYTYEVLVNYVQFYKNMEIEGVIFNLINPTIVLKYTSTTIDEDGQVVNNDGSATVDNTVGSGVKFVGIPYSSTITLNVTRGVSVGFKMMGWYKANGTEQLIAQGSTKTQISMSNLSQNMDIAYRVDFEEYEVVLNYGEEQGSPILNINNMPDSSMKMGDKISIVHNQNMDAGYIFHHYEYQQSKLVDYVGDESTFATDWENLYIISNGFIFKNISSVYDETIDYKQLDEEKETISIGLDALTDGEFVDPAFNIANYSLDSNVIEISLIYNSAEIKIINVSKTVAKVDNVTNQEILPALNLESLKLNASDIAVYTIKAVSGGVERPIIANSDDHKVTIYDTIKITIQIATNAVNAENKSYNLAKGLILNQASLSGWNGIDIDSSFGGGKYVITFDVADNITRVREGAFTIEYGYEIKEAKRVTVTTNMAGSTDFINNTILKIDSVTDASSHTQGGTPVGTIYQLNPFLQDVGISLSLNEQGLTDMTNYFVINSVDVYLDPSKNGEKLEANKLGFEEYVDYLINKQNDANYIVTISDVSLIFQFNLQPRLYVEGNEITTQQEVQITRTYDFEVSGGNIVGKAQVITFGEISSSVDISCYGYDYLQAKIYKGITPIEDGAIDVGEYYIKLEFKDSVTDDQRKDCWLYYIEELHCRIKLVVDPATVTLQLDESNSAKFNKDYSKSSEYTVKLRQYVKNSTTVYGSVDKNIILKGTDNKGRSFDLTNVNIASDDQGVIVSGGKTAGLTNQMYVTNSEVHILITGLRITDNSNIVLKLEEFDCYENAEDTMPDKKQGLLIENIVKIVPKVVDIVNFEVFDKVEDEDAFADFSFKEGETEYIQWIFENDKVNLLKEEVKVYFTSKPIEDGENILDIADATVDSNKYIVIDARSALDGADKNNYVIGNKGFINFKDTKTIYPRKVDAPIKGVGTVELVNERGVQDYRKANLIPVGATLVVERIEPNSAGYRDIESMLTEFVSRRNVFAAGYKLVLLDKNGKEIKISNELYLSMPTETDLMNVVSLAGDRAKSVDFTKDGGNIIIDLSQIEEDISTFCLIQNRALLKAWQIVLIVVLSLVGAAGIGIGVFFIIRRRRLKNEKYDTI